MVTNTLTSLFALASLFALDFGSLACHKQDTAVVALASRRSMVMNIENNCNHTTTTHLTSTNDSLNVDHEFRGQPIFLKVG